MNDFENMMKCVETGVTLDDVVWIVVGFRTRCGLGVLLLELWVFDVSEIVG